MIKCNESLIQNILEHNNVQTFLEIGSGKCSTRLARRIFRHRKSGFRLSLESNEAWFKKMSKLCPRNRYGHVVKTDMEWDKGRLFLNYNLKKKFDFILIDGPTVCADRENGIYKKLVNYTSKDNVWIKKFPFCGGGASSIHMLEYVLPAFKKNTFVLVDYRLAAVYNYLQTFRDKDELVFLGVSNDEFLRRKHLHRNVLKTEFWEDVGQKKLIKSRPTGATIIFRKNNDIIYDMLKDLKINTVPLL